MRKAEIINTGNVNLSNIKTKSVFINIYRGDGNVRFISTVEYRSYNDAYALRDPSLHYIETVELIRHEK